jgi:hypothetical protein
MGNEWRQSMDLAQGTIGVRKYQNSTTQLQIIKEEE